MKPRLLFCWAALLWVTGPHVSGQMHWPEFRGPTADGHGQAKNLPTQFSESKNILWKTPIHGRGWSSPVVWGEQVWLTTASPTGTTMSLVCVDLNNGQIIHDLTLLENENPADCHPQNSYATPTPVVEEGRVYAHFGSYGTACIDSSTGKTLWNRTDLKCDHYRGPASSPILFHDLLIVAFDGFDVQYVVALDKTNGKTIWKTERDIDYPTDNGDLKKAYCTGTVFEVNGEPLLIYPSAVATEAFHARSGKRKWIVYHEGMNASARPIRFGDLVFITNGMGKMIAVNPSGSGNITDSNIAWTQSKAVSKKSSLTLAGRYLFMVDDKGVISCLEPTTGEAVWRERVGGTFAASPVYADGKLWFLSVEGKVLVLKPGRKFHLIAENRLGDGFKASPAIVNDRLIVRSQSSLYCIAAQ